MGHVGVHCVDDRLGLNGMDAIMTRCLWLLVFNGVGILSAQVASDWTLDVRVLTSIGIQRPEIGEGIGWNGQAMQAKDGPLMSRWGFQGTRSFGVSIRRRLGDAGQLAFGLEQTRRIWRLDCDWLPELASAPVLSAEVDWIVASYSFPILYRTEVRLGPGWRLGAGGGLVLEILPTNAFSSSSITDNGNVLAVEHSSLRYSWNRVGMGLELGVIKEGKDMDLHVGGVLRPLIQPLFRGDLVARWNVGQPDADLREMRERVMDGSWWGLDLRLILH